MSVSRISAQSVEISRNLVADSRFSLWSEAIPLERLDDPERQQRRDELEKMIREVRSVVLSFSLNCS